MADMTPRARAAAAVTLKGLPKGVTCVLRASVTYRYRYTVQVHGGGGWVERLGTDDWNTAVDYAVLQQRPDLFRIVDNGEPDKENGS